MGHAPSGAHVVGSLERWLFSYGGGGGLLCLEAAEILGIPQVVVFPHSSVFSAFGASLLPLAHSYHTVVPAGVGRVGLTNAVARLADNARRDLRAEGITDLEDVRAELRIASGEPRSTTLAALLEPPRGCTDLDEQASDSVRCRLHVSVGHDPVVEMITEQARGGACRLREVRADEGRIQVPILQGLGRASPGAAAAAGPTFLEAPDTTIFVPRGWSASFTRQGYGMLTQEPGS